MDLIDRVEKALPRYHVYGVLGAGGYAVVLGAIDKTTRETRAIKWYVDSKQIEDNKIQPTAKAEDIEYATRYRKAFNHPNFLKIYENGTIENTPYVIMELFEGKTLEETLATDNTDERTLRTIKRIFKAGAKAIAQLHKQGLYHGDLKPQAILHDKRRTKIIDYDTVRPSPQRPDTIKCTPGYVAPEQIFGDQTTSTQSDIYQWTATFYAALCGGETPLIREAKRKTSAQKEITDKMLFKILRDGIKPRLPPEIKIATESQINHILSQGMHEDPKQRPNISELGRMIDEALDMTITLQAITPDKSWTLR